MARPRPRVIVLLMVGGLLHVLEGLAILATLGSMSPNWEAAFLIHRLKARRQRLPSAWPNWRKAGQEDVVLVFMAACYGIAILAAVFLVVGLILGGKK